jgi:hypothetical protein
MKNPVATVLETRVAQCRDGSFSEQFFLARYEPQGHDTIWTRARFLGFRHRGDERRWSYGGGRRRIADARLHTLPSPGQRWQQVSRHNAAAPKIDAYDN